MNHSHVLEIIVLLSSCVLLNYGSGPWFGSDALSTWKSHGDKRLSIRESLFRSKKGLEPPCVHCIECTILEQILYKDRCRSKSSSSISALADKTLSSPTSPPSVVQPNVEKASSRNPLATGMLSEVRDPARCKFHFNNVCRCHQDICCAFDRHTNSCISIETFCLNLTYSRDECRRPLKYYAYGGVLCRNYYRGGNCKNFKTFLAVNVNGVKATGSDNITYQRGSTLTICDPQDTRCYDSLTDSHEDYMGLVHRGDRCLYKSYIYSLHRENCNCLSTPIKRLVDGRYELILKFVDPSLTGRTFDIKLNKVTVLKDFRILRYTSINYKPLEAFIQIEVRDNRTTLILKGHPPSKIKKCKISLAFCRGDCSHHRAYIISAIAVLQYPEGLGLPSGVAEAITQISNIG